MNPALDHNAIVTAATQYIARGLQVVPLSPGTKAPLEKDWLKLIFTPADFKPNDNIGIRSVNGLVDIDCDSPEVVEMAKTFLPKTGAIYGRESKPFAHWLYRSTFDKRIAFVDLIANEQQKATLVEIRVNHQSMAPPSVHPEDGELLEWQNGGFFEITEVPADPLLRYIQLLSTAALVGRYYNPPGNRHDWCLSLSGFFRQLGIEIEECKLIISTAAGWARDLKTSDRLAEINSTYSHGEGDPLKSAGSLKELMGRGAGFIKTLNKIWGTSSQAFRVSEKEKIIPNDQINIKLALKRLGVQLSYDEFRQQQRIKYLDYDGPLVDIWANKIWLHIDRNFHFRPTIDFYETVIKDVAYENRIHPVKTYLSSLEWDKKPRLDTWLIRHADAANTDYVRAVSSIVLIAAVRRIYVPGCKYDELVVLESEQGQLKSSALRALCPVEDWFSDDLPLNLDAKQIIERTIGKWIIEAAELSGMSKSQTEHLKSMLSRQEDGPVRLAYDRHSIIQPRQFIIIGTTNAHVYLHDSTGNRRFWPIRIDKFNILNLLEERDQLWAEAVVRESKGESIRLHPSLWPVAEIQQNRRYVEDAWESVLREKFDKDVARITPTQLWDALDIPMLHRSASAQMRIYQILQKMGFKKMSILDKTTNKVVKGWGKGAWRKGLPIPEEGVNHEHTPIKEDEQDM